MGKWEHRSIGSIQAHAYAALEFLGVGYVHPTNDLCCYSEPHEEVCLSLDVYLPGRILSVECAIVGTSTSCILIPHSIDLLLVHALSFGSDRSDDDWLIALDLKNASQVSILFV